jgi:hypothetical protein
MKTTDKKHAKAKSSLFMGSSVEASFLRRKKIRKAREKFQGVGFHFALQKNSDTDGAVIAGWWSRIFRRRERDTGPLLTSWPWPLLTT